MGLINYFDNFGGGAYTSDVPITGVAISGPSNAGINEPLSLSATIAPTTATNVTYAWEGSPLNDGEADVIYERVFGNELAFDSQIISLTASNPVSSASDTHTVAVWDYAARGVIYDIINGLSSLSNTEKAYTGPVYAYKRWTALRPDFLTLFKTTDAASEDTIRGFEITLHNGNIADEQIIFREGDGRGGIQQTILFNIYGYFTWNDSDKSEIIASSIVNQAIYALDRDDRLHDGQQFISAANAQLIAFEPWLFGSTLVHRATIQQAVTTYFYNGGTPLTPDS